MADNRSALHQGQATERNVNNASARVGFDDLDATVSGEFQVLFPAAGGWNFFWTPKEGDQVVISRLPNGSEEGYVLGKVYTAGKMPQGGAPNIILIVSDDGKNVIRFDADKGTLDLVVDKTGTEKYNNHKTEVNENEDLLVGGNQETVVVGYSKHTSTDTDIQCDGPIGLEGSNTKAGKDVLQIFFDDLKKAVTRNPVMIPPASLPPGAPVPPVPPVINMHLKAVWDDIAAAVDKAKVSCAKALK
jgi:phage baseplate assembly protein gpV